MKYNKIMYLLVKKKIPDKFSNYLSLANNIWLISNNTDGTYTCMLCDQVVGNDLTILRFADNHALQHIKDLNLMAFI